ncbi:MAG: hypothetical protein ACYC2K_11845 [Gemmatimonadales bacterium]
MRVAICLFGLSILTASSVAAQDAAAATKALATLLQSKVSSQSASAAAGPSAAIELPWSRATVNRELAEALPQYGIAVAIESGNRLVATDSAGAARFEITVQGGLVYLASETGSSVTATRVRKAILAAKRRGAVSR